MGHYAPINHHSSKYHIHQPIHSGSTAGRTLRTSTTWLAYPDLRSSPERLDSKPIAQGLDASNSHERAVEWAFQSASETARRQCLESDAVYRIVDLWGAALELASGEWGLAFLDGRLARGTRHWRHGDSRRRLGRQSVDRHRCAVALAEITRLR